MKLLTSFVFVMVAGLLLFKPVLANEDKIVEFIVQEQIGFEEVPVIQVEVQVSKTRELHVAVVNLDGWKTVKKTQKRIKQSGKFHFELPIENLQPGKYRIDAYLSPRRKGWKDRITEPTRRNLLVLNKTKNPKKSLFSKQDKIKKVNFPKQVVGSQAVELNIHYEVTEARDLHIKLLDSSNWQEFGVLKFTVTENGQISIPLSNMPTDFPTSKFAWVIYLTEINKLEPISKKQGKHFLLTDN
ncbi:hypothetical protein [Paraglaciecola sp. L3A3]|uniref:hypothetical protein n=1 Tax=Paraglaciecola sp. L3A3 TaxID=2686358 RepID=UPI00131ECFFC|nr:hypothetical protein [Paraglaciecola sp. L3A3]